MFQSTHSVWSATMADKASCAAVAVSIHALRVECDSPGLGMKPHSHSFNPRTPCGVRLDKPTDAQKTAYVSIHALRVECDGRRRTKPRREKSFNPRTPCGVRLYDEVTRAAQEVFQSTHSVWSATHADAAIHADYCVSIHALRVECDWAAGCAASRSSGFNPRTPCGVRRVMTLLSGVER